MFHFIERAPLATYVIGDVHGCFKTLKALWRRLDFDTRRDRLWMVGDLVNRGPDSLAVLRWARKKHDRLDDRFVAVLGNHDLHLLAFAAGRRPERPRDTLRQITDAPDAADLVAWVRHRPLLYQHRSTVLVHAGLLPSWSLRVAIKKARKAEKKLRGKHGDNLVDLSSVDDQNSKVWHALRVFTSMRCCTADGSLCDFSGSPGDAPAGCVPWFEISGRRRPRETVVFGHWAALGVHVGQNAIGLDSGCVWGGYLSAIRLEDRQLFQQPSLE